MVHAAAMVPKLLARPALPLALPLLAALAPLASLAAAGCGPGLECGEMGLPVGFSFVVDLSVEQGSFPADLVIKLTGGGVNEEITMAEIEAAQPEDPCVLDAGVVTCLWGSSGPGRGTFDATAAGYQPLHLDLAAVEDECGVRAAEQQGVLQAE